MPITLVRIPHDKQVAVATFLDFGHSYRKIAQALDISTHTVMAIAHQFKPDFDELETCKKTMIQKTYGLAHRAFNRISDDKLDSMNALQLTTIAAIGVDKGRDMEGNNRPVFNIVTVVNETKTALSHINAQISAIQARKLALSTANTNVVV